MLPSEFPNLFARVQRRRRQIQYSLDMMMVDARIDEMGILFFDEQEIAQFTNWAEDQGGIEHIQEADEIRVIYRIDSNDVKKYSHHVKASYFGVTVPEPGDRKWRIAIQHQFHIDPIRSFVSTLFRDLASGSIIYAGYEVPDLNKAITELSNEFIVVGIYDNDLIRTAFMGAKLADNPYLCPRQVHSGITR